MESKKKYFWLALCIKEQKWFYSYAMRVSESDNIANRLSRIEGVISANIMQTKKQAFETVRFWNECYKQNGTYLFDSPAF
jgi:hypothetical protein